MTETPSAREIAEGLTEAQRRAVNPGSASLYLRDDTAGVTWWRLKKLGVCEASTTRLTPLGLAVRSHIGDTDA